MYVLYVSLRIPEIVFSFESVDLPLAPVVKRWRGGNSGSYRFFGDGVETRLTPVARVLISVDVKLEERTPNSYLVQVG